MSFISISAPEPGELAVNHPEGGLQGYEQIIGPHQKYWGKQWRRGTQEASPALENLGREFFESFDHGYYTWVESRRGSRQQESARRFLVGTLALSLFLRLTWGANNMQVQDGVGHGDADSLVDFCSNEDPFTESPRVHTRFPEEGPDAPINGWEMTESGTLYIHHSRPARPSATMGSYASARFGTDFNAFMTLTPYLPNHHKGEMLR